ncbi:hypothetical protein Tco_1574097, partial [Tanacetum coccineum]
HPPPPPPPPTGPSRTSGASGASRSSQSPPPPPPPSNTQGGQSIDTDAPNSSKTAASAEYMAWTMTDTTLKPLISSIPEALHMGDDTTADEQAYSSSGEDVGRDHIPTSIPSSDLTVLTNNWASALKSTYKPPPENSLLAQIGGPAYEIVKVFHPDVVHLQFQMEECHKLLIDQMDDAILRPTLSISKMKAAYYPDVGLEQMVPDQMWIEEECKYDVAAMDKYGVQMIMRFNEIHKFSDGTLHQLMKLDYRVKEFRVNRRNPGLDTRFWTKKDVDRSKEFMFAIQKRLLKRTEWGV